MKKIMIEMKNKKTKSDTAKTESKLFLLLLAVIMVYHTKQYMKEGWPEQRFAFLADDNMTRSILTWITDCCGPGIFAVVGIQSMCTIRTNK